MLPRPPSAKLTWVVKIPFLTSERFSADEPTAISVVDAQMGYPGGRTTSFDVTGVEVTLNRTPALAGDMDGDRDVGVDDFLLFAEAFGTSCGEVDYDPLADLDGNCTVGVDDFLLFAGQFGESLSKLAALARDMLGLPLTPVLYPNTPNPFNPSTTLAYELPQAGEVTLTVYSVAGQRVATLVSGYQDAGHYEVTWDGSKCANGMYLYRLETRNFAETRRMVLMK